MAKARESNNRFSGVRAVALMSFWKLRNMLRTLFTDPRKLIPVLFVVGCFGMAFFGFSTMRSATSEMKNSQTGALAEYRKIRELQKGEPKQLRRAENTFDTKLIASLDNSIDPVLFSSCLSLVLILLGLMLINTGLGDGLLAFAAPDVDYLFPSPVSRRVVIAYRIPGLTLAALATAIYLVFMLNMVSGMGKLNIPNAGHTISPMWVPLLAMCLFGGSYLNVAMFIAVRFQQRKFIRKVVIGVIVLLAVAIGALLWKIGIEALEPLIQSEWVRWIFLPSTLASETLVATYSHLPAGQPLIWLAVVYALSLIPMLTTNANWYEQSIVVSERMSAIREAAKGGVSAVFAARAAASFSEKHLKEYAVKPFGQGATALLWAHLCAAAKKPFINFVLPMVAGIGVGFLATGSLFAGSFVTHSRHANEVLKDSKAMIGFTFLFVFIFYSGIAFMTLARNAAEAAIRRRELVSPLPIKGWQVVAADMGMPMISLLLFYVPFAIAYSVFRGDHWPLVLVGVGIGLPLRAAGRIALQYIVVIAYPDLADKIQRLMTPLIYSVVSTPFLLAECVFAIPGFLFKSFWGALIPVILLQVPLLVLFLFLAGRASQKAVASGEPVSLIGVLRGKL